MRRASPPLGAASAVTWRSTGKAQNGSIWRYVLPPGASEPSDSAEERTRTSTSQLPGSARCLRTGAARCAGGRVIFCFQSLEVVAVREPVRTADEHDEADQKQEPARRVPVVRNGKEGA
jgi:hypothetical protein